MFSVRKFFNLLALLFLIFYVSGCGNSNSSNSSAVHGTALLGNIANANVNIYKMGSDGLKTLLWSEKTSNVELLDGIGKFNTHSSELDSNSFYLYEVVGGEDWDHDDDGVKDSNATTNKGTFHSIIKGEDVINIGNSFTVTYLSELLYQAVKYDIGQDDFNETYFNESKNLLSSNEVNGISQTDILKKIDSFVPAKNELNLATGIDRDIVVKSIENGNVQNVPQSSFISASLLRPQSNVAAGSVVPLVLNIKVPYAYDDLATEFFLVRESDNNTTILDGFTLTNVSSSNSSYNVETLIPNDIQVGDYHIDVVFSGDKNATQSTAPFSIVSNDSLHIDDLVFDEDSNTSTTKTTDINNRALNKTLLAPKSIEMSYSDGNLTISSALQIENRSSEQNITNVTLGGYIDVSGTRINVPFESVAFGDIEDKNNTVEPAYSNVIKIPVVSADTILNISTNIMISKENILALMRNISATLITNPTAVLDANIVLELRKDNHDLIDSYSYPVTFFMSDKILEILTDNISNLVMGKITVEQLLSTLDVSNNQLERSLRSTSTPTTNPNNKLKFSKNFDRSKFSRRAGAGIYCNANSYIDEDGIHANANAVAKVKVLKKTHYKIFDAALSADVNPGSFEDTGYDLVIKSFGLNLYAKSKSLSDVSGMQTPEVEDMKSAKVKKAVKFKKAKKMVLTGSASSLVGYVKTKNFGIVKSKKQTIIAGFIPVVVEVGAQATVGYIADIHLEGITKLTASLTPTVKIGSWIDGGVGAGFDFFGLDIDYSAGVGGSFYLLNDNFKNSVTASIDLVEDENGAYIKYLEGNLNEKIRNYFHGPRGRFYLYGKWFGPKYKSQFYKPWKWHNHKRTKTLMRWSTTKHTKTLLNKNQNLFRVTLVPDIGLKYPDGLMSPLVTTYKNILFAHGVKSDKSTWNTYATEAESKGWTVYRTDVDEFGSIAARAKELATYINQQNLEDNSLVAIGHSMGGLDLRYIVSRANEVDEEPFTSAAKKITAIYTIATPHGGSQLGGIVGSDGTEALHDLGLKQMAEFNKKYPYSTLKVGTRVIPFLAIRSACDNPEAFGADGVVSLYRQSLDGASYRMMPYTAKHNESATLLCSDSIKAELDDVSILDDILATQDEISANKEKFSISHRDIIFYSKNSCEGDVVGKFNSNADVDIDCSQSDECINNKASSVMLYPNVKKHTIIRVYDHPDKKTSTKNYMSIYRGIKEWNKPVCISGFEHSTSSKESGYGITTSYNKKDSSKGLNGEVSHIRVWNKQ